MFRADGGILGGAERYAMELARHMAERVPTTLVSFGPRRSRERIGSLQIEVYRPLHYVRGDAWNPLSMAYLSSLARGSVVHCHQYKICVATLAAAFCRLSGRRVFASDLGGAGLDLSAYVSTRAWYHGMLHISRFSRRIAGEEDSPRAHVIYGGVAEDRFFPDASVPRDGSVVYVGRILPHKGIDDLVRAIPDNQPLHIIGPRMHAAYYDLLVGLARGKRVTFTHGATDDELRGFYRRAIAVVLPSVYTDTYGHRSRAPELLGQTLLEGMACGTPGLCTDVASLPEIAVDGVTGFVVPEHGVDLLRQRLVFLRDHPDAVEAMGRRALQRTREHFSWSRVVDTCLALYAGRRSGGA